MNLAFLFLPRQQHLAIVLSSLFVQVLLKNEQKMLALSEVLKQEIHVHIISQLL